MKCFPLLPDTNGNDSFSCRRRTSEKRLDKRCKEKDQRKVTFLPRYLTTMSNETGFGRRFPKGDRKALWSAEGRNTSGKGVCACGRTRGLCGRPLDPFAPFSCLFSVKQEKSYFSAPASETMPNEMGPEGFQRATGKPFGRPKAETLRRKGVCACGRSELWTPSLNL